MADLIAIDGCAHYNTQDDIWKKWECRTSFYYKDDVPRRPGIGYIDAGGSTSYTGGRFVKPGYNTAIMGAAVRIGSNCTTRGGVFSIQTLNDQPQINCVIKDGNRLAAQLGETYTADEYEIATGPSGAITVDHWHYIEFKCYLHETAGQYAGYIDGVLQFSGTGPTLYTGTNNEIEFMAMIGAHTGKPIYFCDIYMYAGVDYEGTVLGDCRVDTVHPVSNSAPLQFTPSGADNYLCVNSRNVQDDSYYVFGGVGQRDMYGFDDLPNIGYPEVYGLSVTIAAASIGAGARWIRGQAGGARHPVHRTISSTTYRIEQYIFETDPNYVDDRPWNTSSINASDFGVYVNS